MPVTIYDVAKKAGCSHTTVSRVLNGKGQDFISETTRQKVLAAVMEMGYRPNRMKNANSDTSFIGVWMPEYFSAFFNETVNELSTVLGKQGYDILPVTTGSEASIQTLPMSGLIALEVEPYLENLMAQNAHFFTPVVSIGTRAIPGIDCVVLDLYAAAKKAVLHLAGLDRKRIAMVTIRTNNVKGEPRLDAYTDVMNDTGRAVEVIEAPDLSQHNALEAVKKYISEKGCPDAIFCMSDHYAVPVHKCLRVLGYTMPDDVALIGFDGTRFCEFLDPSLSSVAYPVEKFVKQACELLIKRIKDSDRLPQTIKPEPDLILRETA
jgi:DNA-binding LacI/PurR family transcriptional regulator